MGMSERDGGVGRRVFLSGVGAVAGVVATGAVVEGTLTEGVLGLGADEGSVYGLRAGMSLGGRWTIVAVHPARMGAIPVVLATASGARFQVDVLRRDSDPTQPLGVGNTAALSLFLANRGDGRTSTDEEHGLGAMALADALREREARHTVPAALSTLGERALRYPTGAYAVDLG